MSDRLQRILDSRRRRVDLAREAGDVERVRRQAERLGASRRRGRFLGALQADGTSVIAEIKQRSPSAGVLSDRPVNPLERAAQYQQGGAAAISVVVEQDHFDGRPEWVAAVAGEVDLPLLWKDFVIDLHVIDQAVVAGASAVLLIAAALGDRELELFHGYAHGLGLDVLVEVHDRVEADRALRLPDPIVGVNARDLKTFEVDLGRVLELGPVLSTCRARVAESGIGSRTDVERLEGAGFDAVLVGETLMRSGDPVVALRELRGA